MKFGFNRLSGFERKINKMLNMSDLGARSMNDLDLFDIYKGSCNHLVNCIYQL